MRLKCRKPGCGYVWDYKGKNTFYATCPHCLGKVNVKTCRVEINAED